MKQECCLVLFVKNATCVRHVVLCALCSCSTPKDICRSAGLVSRIPNPKTREREQLGIVKLTIYPREKRV